MLGLGWLNENLEARGWPKTRLRKSTSPELRQAHRCGFIEARTGDLNGVLHSLAIDE
jgi:hypothetical protein